jgi:hypothetical protein
VSKLRFTDAEKWRDPWYQGLSLLHKALWQYLTDNCDNAGVWVVNQREAEFHLGERVDWGVALAVFTGRVEAISPTKWHLVKFISFQYPGGLSEKSAPHRQVKRLLAHHGISLEKEPTCSLHGLRSSPKDKDTDQDKDEDEDKDSNAEDLFDPQAMAQAKSIMAADAKPKPAIPSPPKSFVDFRAMHGRIFVGRDEKADWEALLRAYEWDAMHEMHEALKEDRIYLNAATAWLSKHYRITE